MKKHDVLLFMLILFFVTLALSGCQSIDPGYTRVQDTNAFIIDLDRLTKYKDSYVGDNSAVAGILYELPGNIYIKNFSLQTNNLPYIIKVTYGLNHSDLKEEDLKKYWTEDNLRRVFLNNATALFILVKNVDEVKLSLEAENEKTLSISRKDIEDFYGKDIKPYASDKSLWLKEIIHETINNSEKISKFYSQHQIN